MKGVKVYTTWLTPTEGQRLVLRYPYLGQQGHEDKNSSRERMDLRNYTTGGRVAHAEYPWWHAGMWEGKVIVGNINTKSVYDMKNVDSNCRIDMLRVRVLVRKRSEGGRGKDELWCIHTYIHICRRIWESVFVVFIATADFDEKYDYVLYANALQ